MQMAGEMPWGTSEQDRSERASGSRSAARARIWARIRGSGVNQGCFRGSQALWRPSAPAWGRVQPASGGQTGRRAQQIVESQQQRQSLPVFVLAAVADLVIAEVPFHGAKRMLHLGPQ